ncbi:reverse transcriptase domain-containing protein [Tanacetum coccineum]
MLTITLIGSSASLAYSIFLEFLKMQSCSEFFPLLLPGPQKDGWTDSPQELSIPGISSKRPLSKGTNSRDDTSLSLIEIQTMADHSQKWHDGTTSRNIGSSSSNDGLAALVGCQIYEGPHLDKDCPLNEEVKQVKEHQEESTRRSTKMEVWIKKLQKNAKINTRNQSASLKNLETQIEQLTKEIHSNKTPDSSSGQIKIVTANQEMSVLNKLHGVSFISKTKSDTPDALQHQLPPKELNLGSFTLPCTIGNFNFYAMADLGASVNVLPKTIFEYLDLTNLSETDMLVEMADIRKRHHLG